TKFTTTDSRRNSPPRDSRRNNFQTRWGEIGPGFQNYGNFNQSEPLNRRLPQDMELFQYNILKKLYGPLRASKSFPWLLQDMQRIVSPQCSNSSSFVDCFE
ncbi:hypothetical protein TNCT_448111, partial [Trichonephila clavata]